MAKRVIEISTEGLEKLKAELYELKNVKRKEIQDKIETARGYGDLSENSEYDEAKNEQAQVEGRISELEEMIKYAHVIDDSEVTTERVFIGSRVTVERDDGKKAEYRIVGPTEADPFNGAISDESPVGKALKDKKKGEKVEVELPTGKIVTYKILKISK